MNSKQVIREFLQSGFSDAKLDRLYCYAKTGVLGWSNPNYCLVGLSDHYNAICVATSPPAVAFHKLGDPCFFFPFIFGDTLRRKRILPLIEAELERRSQERNKEQKAIEKLIAQVDSCEKLTWSSIYKEKTNESRRSLVTR